jgi:hypothetical protein
LQRSILPATQSEAGDQLWMNRNRVAANVQGVISGELSGTFMNSRGLTMPPSPQQNTGGATGSGSDAHGAVRCFASFRP